MQNRKVIIGITWVISISVIIALFMSCPTQELKAEYFTICINLFIIWCVWLWRTARGPVDLFEPIVLVTVIHLLLFEVTPLICLFQNDILWFGVNTWGGCIKGTWISTIAYLCIAYCYFHKNDNDVLFVDSIKNHSCVDNCISDNLGLTQLDRHNMLVVNYFLWFVGFISSIILLIEQGSSLTYILSLGMGEVSSNAQSTSSVEFLGVIAYIMIPSFLYIFALSNSRLIKIIIFYFMSICFLMRGFRFILISVILSPFILSSLIRKKRPGIIKLLSILVIILIMIAFVGATRDTLRAGNGMAESVLSAINGDYIFELLVDNFSIFKTYYGIVLNIPKNFSYTCGQLMILYTFLMFIPRGIWASKPFPISKRINEVAVSAYASRAGTAYPYLGEYYHEFGILGIVIFPCILGKFCKKLNKMMYKQDIHSYVLFATFYTLLMQLMIRGYTPSNFYMLLICYIPILVSRRFGGGIE